MKELLAPLERAGITKHRTKEQIAAAIQHFTVVERERKASAPFPHPGHGDSHSHTCCAVQIILGAGAGHTGVVSRTLWLTGLHECAPCAGRALFAALFC